MIKRSKSKKPLTDEQVLKDYTNYCSACGSKEQIVDKKLTGYDSETGGAEYAYRLVCPKAGLLAYLISIFSINKPMHTDHWLEVSVEKKFHDGERYKFVHRSWRW